ncbi:CMRF35-like molecule 1 [Nyctibius grandis]|uniref:CMRF35-like molecule 1 n=1 Tax=Nyctibius grandis TaxID=48427 RepID=UPI0035BC5604
MELRVLLMLPLCFPGLHAQTTSVMESRSEGSTLSLQCSYAALAVYQQQKAWCRVTDDGQCEPLVETTYPNQNQYTNRATKGYVTIEDDSTRQTVSITMTNLQAEDSDTYVCAYRSYTGGYLPLKTISLQVFKEVHKSELDSLSVQCKYRAWVHSTDIKTWCRRDQTWCKIWVSTDGSSTSSNSKALKDRALIQDDTKKRTITITIQKLQAQDAGVYWCALFTYPQITQIMEVRLSVSKKTQQYTVKESGNVSVQCRYSAQDYGAVSKAWCKEGARRCTTLVTTVKPSEYRRTLQQGRVTIQDDTQQGIVTITMEKLQARDSGVYWCALYEDPHLFRMVEVTLKVAEISSERTLSGTAGTNQSTPSSNIPPPSFSSNINTSIILSVVLSILFILALISLITLCVRQRKQLKRKGTREAENIYEKPEDIAQLDTAERTESTTDDSKDLKYVTLNFKSRLSSEDPLYCNVEPSQTPRKPKDEDVEYAIIALKQLPTKDEAQNPKTIQKWEKRTGIQSGNGE